MNDLLEETEEQQAARVIAFRARVALRKAPEIVGFVRARVGGLGAERGETDAHYATPLRPTPTDAADWLYTKLAEQVAFWVEELGMTPPPTLRAWRVTRDGVRDVNGFRAGTGPQVAQALTGVLCRWLGDREETIAAHEAAGDYQMAVAGAVFRVGAQYPLAPRPDRVTSPRSCEVCLQPSVSVEFFGESFAAAAARGEFDFGLFTRDERRDPKTVAGRMVLAASEGVQVRCGECGWAPARQPRLSDIVGWLA